MRYESIFTLEAFLTEVETQLLSASNRHRLKYPQSAVQPWNADFLAKENEAVLTAVAQTANVYMLFSAESCTDDHKLRYIGKTTKKLARERIRNHFFKKNERTGSKLAEVVEHTCLGGTVEIAWATIEPESLRNFIEEELIHRHPEADWNRENKAALRRTAKSGSNK
jgi:hypothetical protein